MTVYSRGFADQGIASLRLACLRMHPNEKEKPRQKQDSLIFPSSSSDSNFNFYISGIEETRQEISGSGLALASAPACKRTKKLGKKSGPVTPSPPTPTSPVSGADPASVSTDPGGDLPDPDPSFSKNPEKKPDLNQTFEKKPVSKNRTRNWIWF